MATTSAKTVTTKAPAVLDLRKILKMPETGSQPFRLERYLLPAIPPKVPGERVVIHHVTNTHNKLQLDIERRWKEDGVVKMIFERIYL